MFQFEIGVQSTLESTLDAIGRKVNMKKLEENIRSLRKSNRIHMHLDLVAGLPGDNYNSFLKSIDRVATLAPHHLQIEPVKLLPGSPLRDQAEELKIRFDPNPPSHSATQGEACAIDLNQHRSPERRAFDDLKLVTDMDAQGVEVGADTLPAFDEDDPAFTQDLNGVESGG